MHIHFLNLNSNDRDVLSALGTFINVDGYDIWESPRGWRCTMEHGVHYSRCDLDNNNTHIFDGLGRERITIVESVEVGTPENTTKNYIKFHTAIRIEHTCGLYVGSNYSDPEDIKHLMMSKDELATHTYLNHMYSDYENPLKYWDES